MTNPIVTILIVDDEARNRRLLEALLRPEGYATPSVSNGEQALALIAQSPPDLILLDVMLPGMDGYQVAHILKANPGTSTIPIIMVTAKLDRAARLAGLEAGAEEFLTKPVDRAELWLRVRNLLRLKALSNFQRNHGAILEQQVQARTLELQRFRTAMDATADAILLLNRTTMKFVEVNATACKMLGYTREELLQLDPSQTGTSSLEQLESMYDAVIAGDSPGGLTETRLRRRDGSMLQVEVNYQAQLAGVDWIIVSVLRDITERKQAEAVSLRLAAIVGSSEDAIIGKDLNGIVTSWNRGAQNIFGYTASEMEGTSIGRLIPVERAGEEAVILAKIHGGESVEHFETVRQNKNGRQIDVSVTVSAVKDVNGKLIGVSKVARDITERKASDKALLASEMEFRSLAESMPQIVWTAGSDGKATYLNRRWLDYTGLSIKESLGEEWSETFHPEDRGQVWQAWQHALATTGEYSVEGRMRRADGVYRWWLTRGVPTRDALGNVVKWFGTSTDIHDMKMAELAISRANAELQRQQTELRVLFDLVPAMIWFKDTENGILRVNKRVAEVAGLSVEEIEGKPSIEIYPEHAAAFHVADLEVINSRMAKLGIVETVRDGEGKELWVQTDKVPYFDEDGKVIGIVVMAQDITERKRDQDALRELNAGLEARVLSRTGELEQARNDADTANRAKSSFLAAMSHEIRTPMNGVIGMIDVLHQSGLKGDQVEMVDLIRESAFSLLTIIDDILDFSKIEAGRLDIERAPVSVADVVEKACDMLDQLAGKKGVELTVYVDPTLPGRLLGDGLRLRQVLLNLVGNAIKFSSGRKQAGRVSVRAVQAERSAEHVQVEIHVIDNGIGMDAVTQARVFDAFTQADASTTRRFGGTGLGLVISRHLIELMGGYLTLLSTPGHGSTFTVSLAFARLESEADVVKPASEVAGLRCLVIGGAEELTETIAAYLVHGGARVERAADLTRARTLNLGSAPWIWIIDAVNISLPRNELRLFARSRPEQEIRFIAIGRGSRREPQQKCDDLVWMDGNALTRRRLFRTVAIAAGRAFEEEQAPISGKREVALKPPSREEALRTGRLILVAEDNETNQKVILRQLALLGLAADVADNGRMALERWQSGDYALLLSDIHMPEMDGYELTAAIRTQEQGSRRIPIVALTANALKGEADHCRAIGMDDYLSKPLQLADLKAALETWLPVAGSSPPGEAVPQATAAPAVDVSVLEKLIGNDPAIILEFLNDFRISATKIALELRTACVDQQAIIAGAQAHKLKSSARTVGALALGELCAEMEDAGKAGDTEALARLLPMFEKEFDTVNVSLTLAGAGPHWPER